MKPPVHVCACKKLVLIYFTDAEFSSLVLIKDHCK